MTSTPLAGPSGGGRKVTASAPAVDFRPPPVQVELATKTCTKCGETKSLNDYHRDRTNPDGHHGWCKPCMNAAVGHYNRRRRAEMGDEAWRERQSAHTRRSRLRTGNATGLAYQRARNAAITALIERHRVEFEHLLLLARRNELNEAKR